MKRWSTIVALAALITAAAPLAPASAETEERRSWLESGEALPGDTVDPFTDVSIDGGGTWVDATIVTTPAGAGTLPDSRWITGGSGDVAGPGTTSFRRAWHLPSGLLSSSAQVCVHATDSAVVRLNGAVIIDQPDDGTPANAEDPADCVTVVDQLVAGPNLFEFEVSSASGARALDYGIVAAYQVDLDAPPLLLLPEDMTVEATSADGARVLFQASGRDAVGFSLLPTCTPPSGSVFPVGATTVRCEVTGTRGGTTAGTFTVTVSPLPDVPNAPPVLLLPDDRVVDTKSLTGARVHWTATATDDAGTPTVTCTPSSGSFFLIGTTPVACTAEDEAGLTDTGSFTVTVRGPVQRACDHLAAVRPTWSTYWLQWRLRSASVEVADAGRAADARALRQMADRVKTAGGEYVRPGLHRTAVALADGVADRLGCAASGPVGE